MCMTRSKIVTGYCIFLKTSAGPTKVTGGEAADPGAFLAEMRKTQQYLSDADSRQY